MRNIKTKDHDRKPKIKNPASRMPKELIRTAVLETKAKSSRAANAAASKDSQESPTEYAENKVTSAEEWAAGKTVDTASLAGRRLAKKSYEKIKDRRRGVAAEEAARETAETTEAAAQRTGEAEGRSASCRHRKKYSRLCSRSWENRQKPDSRTGKDKSQTGIEGKHTDFTQKDCKSTGEDKVSRSSQRKGQDWSDGGKTKAGPAYFVEGEAFRSESS